MLHVSADSLSALELMLESLYHMSAEANMQCGELLRAIKTKQELLELQQSNYRNCEAAFAMISSRHTVQHSHSAPSFLPPSPPSPSPTCRAAVPVPVAPAGRAAAPGPARR